MALQDLTPNCDELSVVAPVSVIIVNWNAGQWLERSVASVYAQSLLPGEVILVDNGSTDGSLEAVRRGYPAVHIIEAGANLGFAAANNLALGQLSENSHWALLLNPDACLAVDWIEVMMRAAKNNPDCSAMGCRLMMADSQTPIVDGLGDRYHMSGLAWRYGHNKILEKSMLKPAEIFSPCAAAALYDVEALKSVTGFDEDFFCYFEDVDLGFRLRLQGRYSFYIPEAVATHMGSATTGGKHSEFSVYHGHRNMVWAYIKNMPSILFWLLLPFHLLLNLLTMIYFFCNGKGALILQAKRDAIKAIPQMWRKRRRIQACRKASCYAIWRVLDKRLW